VTAEAEKLLVVKDLMVYFHTPRGVAKALDGVNLEIGWAETYGLVGETGCGKSVTALSIMRLIRPPGKIMGGKIWFEGKELLGKTEEEMRMIRGSKIAMIFQEPMTSLNPVYTIGGQVAEPLKIHRSLEKSEILSKAVDLLGLVRMPEPLRTMAQYPHELSGGMRQRAMIAMMLSCDPGLLIADEPTTALDVTIQAQILQLMRELQKKMKSSILLITHDLGIVAEMCHKVAIMYAGQVVESATVNELFEDPKHPYTIGLLHAIPKLHERVRRLEVIPGSVPDLINIPQGCRFHSRCPHVMDVCRSRAPAYIKVGEEHYAACHLYND
jgi:oligopeptide/dipeptide ABC transporter ATP-binding protein